VTVRDRIREQPLPGEAEAAARSWPVVEAALAGRAPARRQRRLALRLALVAALMCVGLVAALTPAGAEVGSWIGDRFGERAERTAPAFAGLPPGESVLAVSRSGAYAVHPDGSWRRLGPFSDAGWSPHGLHVVGVERHSVVAVDRAGTPKWSVARPGRVSHPAWSTGPGFYVAYLEGHVLRTVGGNGAGDRPLRRSAASVTPAWRPHGGHVLVYARRGGGLEAVDVASGRTLWRAGTGGGGRGGLNGARSGSAGARGLDGVRALAWSRAGRRLVALSARALTLLDGGGRVLRRVELPGAGRQLALHPGGRRAAVAVAGAAGTRVLDVPLGASGTTRQLFQGDVAGLAWSRDGRRLLLAWRDTDEWLLLGRGGRVRRALHGVSAELGPAGGFPRLAGWCCPG
jgi:hypothetical protein